MPEITIPLAGSYTQRDFGNVANNLDQRFINVFPVLNQNPITGKASFSLEKRIGFGASGSTTGSGGHVLGLMGFDSTGYVTATKSGSTVYVQIADGTLVGSISSDGGCVSLTETSLNGVGIVVIVILQGGVRQFWFWAETSGTGSTTTFTGNLTGGSATVTGIASTTGIYVGQLLAQANIPVGTRVQSVDSATQITMTANASGGGGAAFSITRDILALIYDTDFPANTVGEPCYKDGYMFIMTTAGKVWNTDLNSITSIGSSSFTSTDAMPDFGRGVNVLGDYVYAFGSRSIEVFHNVGNVSGSPLGRVGGGHKNIGRFPGIDTGTSATSTAKVVEDAIYFINHAKIPCVIRGGSDVQPIGNVGTARFNFLAVRGHARITGVLMVFFEHSGSGTAANTTLVYFPEIGQKGMWAEIRKAGASSTDYFFDIVATYSGSMNAASGLVALDRSSKKYSSNPYTANNAIYTDDGVAFTTEIQIGPLELGEGNRFTVRKVELIGRKRSTSGNTAIQFSYDDGSTFSTARNVDMSTNQRCLSNCGFGKRLTFKITDAVNAPLVLDAMKIWYEPSTV